MRENTNRTNVCFTHCFPIKVYICNILTYSKNRYLSPSEPDHVISSEFQCALNAEPKTCQTDFGDDFKINVLHGFADLSETNKISADLQCITDDDVFEPIIIEYSPYENNEDYIECIRIDMPKLNDNIDNDKNMELWLRDYDKNNKNMHSLRVEFEMLKMDIEQGFDNVLLSWQYNNIYSHNYVSWTGNDIKTQSKPGIEATQTLFWNVLSNDFLQVCLNLKSDGDTTGNGFKGQFFIRQELGEWSEWTQCQTAPTTQKYRFGGQCGIGIRHKTKNCPTYDWPKPMLNGSYNDGKRICVNNETSLNEFCTKEKCQDFNNTDTSLIPIQDRPPKLFFPYDFEWKFNGKHRVDPIYPDPFRYILATNSKIDVDSMITYFFVFQLFFFF